VAAAGVVDDEQVDVPERRVRRSEDSERRIRISEISLRVLHLLTKLV
jgi:hypothetical protein